MTADYSRYGRQIALPELGAKGQATLATVPVRAPRAVEGLATRLWQTAGGGEGFVETPSGDALPTALAAEDPAAWACVELGVAAWSCVESARAALTLPSAALPDALLQRLTPSR
ncbi:MAG: hypothetical protein U0325_20130 [Polyangiales bacterium]